MLFKDVHASIPMYLFDRSNISFQTGKVTAFTPSHIDVKAPTGKMVVDVTVMVDDKSQTYSIDDSLSIAYFGTTAISPDRESILREIENTKLQSEQRLAQRTSDEEIVTKCNQLLLDNNPALKEKKETEARFTTLEDKLDKLATLMEKFMT